MTEEKLGNGQQQETSETVENITEEKLDKVDKVKKASEEVKNDEIQNEEMKCEEKVSKIEDEKKETTLELLEQIKNQIEFYFGDVNMQRDKFLNDQIKLDEGWIPLAVMLNFKMLAAISKDIDVIIKALEDSNLMEISEDKKKIRRSPKYPLPVYDEQYKKNQEERSIYVKGFPQDTTTMVLLKEFLTPYEPIEHIFMRRYKDKNDKMCFKGSVFVQFTTLDAAKSFMEIESIKYKDTELIRKWSKDYTAEKIKEREEMRAKRDKKKGNKETKTNEKKVKENEKKEQNFLKGCIIHISGLSNDISREDIKEEIIKLDGNVAYIEYIKGNTEAWVRLQEEGSAKNILEKMEDNKFSINGNELSCRVLEDEEEETYLEKVKMEMKNHKHRNNRFRGGRRGYADKRKMSPSRDDTPKKKTKC